MSKYFLKLFPQQAIIYFTRSPSHRHDTSQPERKKVSSHDCAEFTYLLDCIYRKNNFAIALCTRAYWGKWIFTG